MKQRLPVIAIVLLAGVAGLWLILSHHRSTAAARSIAQNSARMEEMPQVPSEPARAPNHDESNDTSVDATAPNGTKILPGPVPAKPQRPALAAAAEPPPGPEIGPGLTPLTVMEHIRSVFREYNQRFGGNPVGTNPEITAALNGANPRQVVFLNEADGMRLNERGQLVDNWGTPFFFHQLSRTEMEIHSAGPDRKMWTADDLVIK
jgi:hypothetical protein